MRWVHPAGRIATRWYVMVGAVWLGRYLTLGNVPWLHDPLWLPWFDQARYLTSALAFANGDLGPDAHWYPLLYPIAAVPFILALPSDPFFLLDLALYLIACLGFRRVAATLGIASWVAVACFLLTTVAQTGLASAWVHPWSSTLSAALIWWLIALILGLRERVVWHRLFAIGAIVAALPLTRPLDAVQSVIATLAMAAVCASRRQLSVQTMSSVAGGVAAVGLPYAMLHHAIYGWAATPYMVASEQMGFVLSDIGWKAYTLLVRAEPWYPGSTAILQAMPWVALGAAGVAAKAITDRDSRAAILLFAMLAIPGSILMLAYVDLQPPGLWEFTNIHYFKWLMPMLGLGVVWLWQGCFDARRRAVASGSVAVVAVALGFGIAPVAVGDAAPARMLLYRGGAGRAWAEAYFAPVVVRDGQGALQNVIGFHQIPDQAGQRAIAVRRLFGSHPRRFDPGDAARLQGALPYGRYAEQVTWLGVPIGRR